MNQSCNAGADVGMSFGTHPRRADVLLHYLSRAEEETGLDERAFAVSLAEAYERLTPESARKIALSAPSSPIYDEYADQRGAVAERLRRYRRVNNPQPIPADLEEAWVAALPEPYSGNASRVLARRYGYIAAARPESVRSLTDAEMIPATLHTVGDAVKCLGEMYADGRVDHGDRDKTPRAIETIDDAVATLMATRAKIIDQTGYAEPTTLHVVRDQSA
mgnify:CR=1 FL=1